MQVLELKQKAIAGKTEDETITTTDRQTVVAKRVNGESGIEPTQLNAEELTAKYSAAIAEVRAAMASYQTSVWRLAWALLDFQELYPQDRFTHKTLGEQLKIELTPARIGQMINTAAAYPRDQVDEKIDFRVYEEVRLITDKKPKITAEKRLAMVVANPTTAEVAKLKTKAKPAKTYLHELVVRSTQAAGVDVDDSPEVEVKLDGRTRDIPEKIRQAAATAIHSLFVNLLHDEE